MTPETQLNCTSGKFLSERAQVYLHEKNFWSHLGLKQKQISTKNYTETKQKYYFCMKQQYNYQAILSSPTFFLSFPNFRLSLTILLTLQSDCYFYLKKNVLQNNQKFSAENFNEGLK